MTKPKTEEQEAMEAAATHHCPPDDTIFNPPGSNYVAYTSFKYGWQKAIEWRAKGDVVKEISDTPYKCCGNGNFGDGHTCQKQPGPPTTQGLDDGFDRNAHAAELKSIKADQDEFLTRPNDSGPDGDKRLSERQAAFREGHWCGAKWQATQDRAKIAELEAEISEIRQNFYEVVEQRNNLYVSIKKAKLARGDAE